MNISSFGSVVMFSSIGLIPILLKISITIVYLFGFTIYYTIDKNTIIKISKKIKHSALRNEQNEPSGMFFGYIYIGYITEIKHEGNNQTQTLYCICTHKQFSNLLNIEKPKTDEKYIKLYTRTGNYFCLKYKSNNFICSDYNPRSEQSVIVDDVVSHYKTNRRSVLMVTGEPGGGKTFLGILIAKALNGSMCKTYKPTEPGDNLRNLYDIVKPTYENPLIIVIDEFDGILDMLHKNEVKCHDNIPIEVRNKMSWNTLLDDINLNVYPFIIVLFTSNLHKTTIINNYEQSYIRKGRIDLYYGISLKQPYVQKQKITSSTGKKVYKREKETNELLSSWDTIAKAAEIEGVCAAKMSRYIKNKTIVNDYYYSVI